MNKFTRLSESSLRILELINSGYTINDIASDLNITHKQLYNRLNILKNQGFDFNRKYFINGQTLLKKRNMKTLTETKEENNDTARMIIISDTHIGSSEDNIKALNDAYDYCIKNNIHVIINGGDLVEGAGGTMASPKIKNLYDQVSYLIENYPFDKNILNFTLLGNHDTHIFKEQGLNIEEVLKARRQDIVPIGFAYGTVSIKKDKLSIYHKISEIQAKSYDANICIKGGSHMNKLHFYDSNNLVIHAPAMCSIDMNHGHLYMPQMLDMELTFDKFGHIESCFINHILITEDEIFKIGEYTSKLKHNGNSCNNQKLEVESFPKVRKLK